MGVSRTVKYLVRLAADLASAVAVTLAVLATVAAVAVVMGWQLDLRPPALGVTSSESPASGGLELDGLAIALWVLLVLVPVRWRHCDRAARDGGAPTRAARA